MRYEDSPTWTEVELLLLELPLAPPLLPLAPSLGPGDCARTDPGEPKDDIRGPPLYADMVMVGEDDNEAKCSRGRGWFKG